MKMKLAYLVMTSVILLSGLILKVETASSAQAPMIQVVKISGADETAVVKDPDGKMRLIKVGDSIGETGKVIEITQGRVVIEEKTDKGPETVIIRIEDGKQRVERIRKSKEEAPPLYSPIKGEEANPSGQGGGFMGR